MLDTKFPIESLNKQHLTYTGMIIKLLNLVFQKVIIIEIITNKN